MQISNVNTENTSLRVLVQHVKSLPVTTPVLTARNMLNKLKIN